MFTGLVQAIGVVTAIHPRGTGNEWWVSGPWRDLELGESIACNGVCLTVAKMDAGAFQVVAGEETLRRSTFGAVQPGRRIHLERALRYSDRLGGHLVQGHVDGVGRIVGVDKHPGWSRIEVQLPPQLMKYVVEKGSICIDGVSLTVNELTSSTLAVGIIPHTIDVTLLGELKVGTQVNIEVDLIARYVERLIAPDLAHKLRAAGFMEP